MDLIEASQTSLREFKIRVRDHEVTADMSLVDGGKDGGMSPVELLVGALAACMGMTIQIYCSSHGLPCEGIEVNAVPAIATNPKRLENVALDITLPDGFPEDRRSAVLKVLRSCIIHRAFSDPPEIDAELD
jgi:putative redox protein